MSRAPTPGRALFPALLVALIGALPIGDIRGEGAGLILIGDSVDLGMTALMLLAAGSAALAVAMAMTATIAGLFWAAAGTLLGLALLLQTHAGLRFTGGPGVWFVILLIGGFLWRGLERLGASRFPATRFAVPALSGCLALYLWEALAIGYAVSPALLPPPSLIANRFFTSADILWIDFQQTVMHAALPGLLLGASAGLVASLVVDRSPFLQRGLLPLIAAFSATPLFGVAPILILWFGIDWQSKVAVAALMVFFPMMAAAASGFQAATSERDLVSLTAEGCWRPSLKRRWPRATPLIFNALKGAIPLALTGAILAEFFGTPARGMGFRIAFEAERQNMDLVWATIAVAWLTAALAYGGLTLVERRLVGGALLMPSGADASSA